MSAVLESPYLKTVDAAALLCFSGPNAINDFFHWANRYGVPRLHRGRTVLWERRVLQDYLERKPWTQARQAKAGRRLRRAS
jgi:hypothetical protein